MKNLNEYRQGEKLSAGKLNVSMEELRRLQNISGGHGINVVDTASGVLIEAAIKILRIDDRYRLDEKYNNSSIIERLCDTKRAEIADFLRIRACVGESPRDIDNQLYRAMLMLDRTYGGGTRGGEGGWITDAGLIGLDYTKHTDGHHVATPLGRIGQMGDVLYLDAGDLIALTSDGDIWCYVNIRHDAHFYKTPAKDGRLHLTDDSPGVEPTGPPLKGVMVCDPAVANIDTELNKESGQWRPQIAEAFPPDTIIVPPIAGELNMPFFRVVSGSSKRAAVFPASGSPKAGWSFETQVPSQHGDGVHLGLCLEFSGVNATGADKVAVFDIEYVVVTPDGSSMSTAAPTARSVHLTIPDGATEDDLYHTNIPVVAGVELSNGDLVIGKKFYRDFDDGNDTFAGDLLICGFKTIWTDVGAPA